MTRKETLARKKIDGICYECEKPVASNRVRCKEHLKKNMISVSKYMYTFNGKRIRRKMNSEKQKKRIRNKIEYRFSYVKGNVRRRGKWKWALTENQYKELINQKCFYCNLENDVETGIGLDRLDNTDGYNINNVVSCCGLCNYTRGSRLTVEEMKQLGPAMAKIRSNRKLNEN